MANTSGISSTTQIIDLSLLLPVQMLQISESEMLWHTEQYLTSFLREIMELARSSEIDSFFLSRWSASRRAVFFPIPGSLLISVTAASINFEGKFTN